MVNTMLENDDDIILNSTNSDNQTGYTKRAPINLNPDKKTSIQNDQHHNLDQPSTLWKEEHKEEQDDGDDLKAEVLENLAEFSLESARNEDGDDIFSEISEGVADLVVSAIEGISMD